MKRRTVIYIVVGVLFIAAYTFCLKYFLIGTASKKTAFVFTEKLFEEFKGSKETMKKLKVKEQRQKYILDSLQLIINTYQRNPKANVALLDRMNTQYDQYYSGLLEENQEDTRRFQMSIWKQINKHTATYGKEKGYDLIIGATGNGNVMYANENMDITEEVISYINDKYEGN